MFDSHSDVAAVVYGPDDDPDTLLRGFAEDLRESGYRAAGLIQLGRTNSAAQDRLPAIALPTGEAVSLRHHRLAAGVGCSLEMAELTKTRIRLSSAMNAGADLVIINRFGNLEARGAGFIDEIRQAVAADLPVLMHKRSIWRKRALSST